jgi:hypothetical protein
MHTESSKSASERKLQQEHKHPDEWQDDLSPNHMAGQNVGQHSEERERDIPTAHELKDMHRVLKDFTDDDLKQIPVLPTGSRLQQGATYVDLADSARQEFRVNAGVTAEPGHYWVPKNRVPYPLWNRLVGEEKPGQ